MESFRFNMNAFFCATPYQIMIAIHLTKVTNKKADIYVLNHFKDSETVVESLKSIDIFNNVVLVDSYKFSTSFPKNPLVRLKERLDMFQNIKAVVKEYFGIEKQYYDQIYLSYPDVIIQLAIKAIYDLNSNVKINLFEDGTAGYNDKILRINLSKKILNKLLRVEKVIDHYDRILLFEPKYYSGKTNIPLESIPKIKSDDKAFVKSVNQLFKYNEEHSITNKFLFLEQPYPDEKLNKEIASIINKVFDKEFELLVKLHPRTKNKKLYEKYDIYANKNIPWEVISMNNSISSKVLISYYSTACFTNKIIFDQEPAIIFLYDLEELINNEYIKEMDKLFARKLKENYKDKERIYIPKNLKELEVIISNLNI